jgi:hypothetical protein
MGKSPGNQVLFWTPEPQKTPVGPKMGKSPKVKFEFGGRQQCVVKNRNHFQGQFLLFCLFSVIHSPNF